MKTDPTQISRRWNDLPEDLVVEIMVRLSSADRIRFAACCNKFWVLMPNHSRDIDHIPWLVREYFSPSLSPSLRYVIKLFDPIRQIAYSAHEIVGQNGLSIDYGVKLLACNHGWLVFAWKERIDTPPSTLQTSFLLFSPFTKQIITLPNLEHSSDGDRHYLTSMVAAFSSEPTSSECVYSVLCQTSNFQIVSISTFRNGDSKWKTLEFDGMIYSFNSSVYHKGVFYLLCEFGELEVYNDTVHVISGAEPEREPQKCSRYPYLLVCEGKLVLVYLYVPYNEDRSDICRVFELEKNHWVEKTSLGDKALFLGRRGSFSVSTTSWPPATREIANRIYYFRPCSGKKHYYSFGDGKSYRCVSRWPGVEISGTWIEPPQLHPHAAAL